MKFNLSEWALRHKGLVLYLMILLGIVGIYSYSKLHKVKTRHLPLRLWWYKLTGREQQPEKFPCRLLTVLKKS